MKKLLLWFILVTSFITAQEAIYTGFRASRIKSSYPNNTFPDKYYWVNAAEYFTDMYSNAQPAGIWIVSLYIENGITQLNFPNPGGSYDNVWFVSKDQNEAYLDYFDEQGLKVWLQVEPGAADVDTLIHMVLNRYKHHPCVIGFGVDVEWLNTHLHPGGQKMNNEDAERWEAKVKAINPDYNLFLKHYGQAWMPSTYRGDILFVDDSQQFANFTHMRNEFISWGQKFSPAKVAFQYGYPKDRPWWSNMPNPPKNIGENLLNVIPNCQGLFWVDFTINEVFPVTDLEEANISPSEFKLYDNYPNPFNSQTFIKFDLPKQVSVKLSVYNSIGELVEVLANGSYDAGTYSIKFDAKGFNSGIYFYTLESTSNVKTGKMIYLK